MAELDNTTNLVNFSDLNLTTDASTTTISFVGENIKVKKYLPIDDKYDLVMVTLQESYEDGIYNNILLDIYFHLNLVYLYTNLVFTDEEHANPLQTFDILKSSGLLDEIINAVDEEEYNYLLNSTEAMVHDYMAYKISAGGVLQSFMTDLPANAEAASNIVDNFDPEQYQAVIDFATAANGGRPISGPNKNQESTTE